MGIEDLVSRLINEIKLSFPFRRLPDSFTYFVTNRCNAQCPHCFYWQSLNKDIEEELNLNEIAIFLKNIHNFKSIAITGGEPTLRGDLLDICKLFLRDMIELEGKALLREFSKQ